MARTNGGIIGKANLSSFEGGLGSTTTKNSSGNITVQPGTRRVQALIVAGGGGGKFGGLNGGGFGGGLYGGAVAVATEAVSETDPYVSLTVLSMPYALGAHRRTRILSPE